MRDTSLEDGLVGYEKKNATYMREFFPASVKMMRTSLADLITSDLVLSISYNLYGPHNLSNFTIFLRF